MVSRLSWTMPPPNLPRIKARAGLWKRERAIASPQGGSVVVAEDALPGAGGHNSGGVELLNLCANNYLGLADHPRLIAAAKAALDSHGFGMASVRFICGTQDLHLALEQKLAAFLRMDDAILFSSCFDANGGVFEALLGAEDAVISDALNHASIIDGIRLCKARRYRYANNDMGELETRLIEAGDARARLIVTDGVFSMDGIIANLSGICDLAERHDAMVMVDDSHAVGFIGARGAGTPERCGVEGRVQLISGTFGKALGGASGGYVAGPKPFVDLLRQRARPYLFSNALAPFHYRGRTRSKRSTSSPDSGGLARDLSRAPQRRVFPQGARRGRLHADAGRTCDHPRDDRRRGRRRASGRRAAATRRLCHGLLLSRCPAWQSAHPHPDERRPHPR